MKRVELQLQINDVFQPVDLDEKTSFSITQKQSELTNPTVTKIPYSAQIALPKTKLNCRLFANIGIRSTADIIDPLSLINFRLYINGSIYQQGYINIEGIDIEDNGFYRIRLYGGLGNFFNFLSEQSLASLDLDCTHKANIEDVYKAMTEDNGLYGYALTYQGEYDKFENGKTENKEGIEDSTWTGTTRYQKVQLDENKRNESDYSGEYRTYYQKPTIKFKPLFEKILKIAEEEKFEIEPDKDFFNETNPYYNDLWLLCNNYKVGDMPGGLGFTVYEFGDTGTAKPDSTLKIEKNDAKGIDNKEILPGRFISATDSTSIDCPVVISDPIKLKNGDKIDVNFITKMIATYYDTSNRDQKYRFKKTDLNCRLELYDVDTGKYMLQATPLNVGENPVQARKFNVKNVAKKRPSNRDSKHFGEQNFAYDVEPNKLDRPDLQVDTDTKWKYNLSYTASKEMNVRVIFRVYGNTHWRVNDHGTRTYGVAFRVLEGGSIVIEGETVEESDRSGSQKTFEDIIGNDYNCFDLLLSYCKMFGLLFKVDDATKKIKILMRDNFYDGEKILDWTYKVDRSKEFSLEPLAFKFQRGVFKYNPLDTKYEEEYRKASDGKEYGSFQLTTGYKIEGQDYNYLDGIIFDNCVIASGYSQYFAGRDQDKALRDNKQLPYLQSVDGSKVDLNGFIPLFRDGIEELTKDCRITDDTGIMRSSGKICWNNSPDEKSFILTNKIPKYLRTIQRGEEFYSLNFGQPQESYSDSEELESQPAKSSIYFKYWRAYILDRINPNCKLLTCYVNLTPSDVNGDLLSKFVYLDDSMWVVDEISSFNPLGSAPTKVKLVKVKDIDNYLHHDNNAEEFKISHNGEVVFDNLEGNTPAVIILNGDLPGITFDISSSVKWKAKSNATIDPVEGNKGDTTLKVEIPADQNSAYVRFVYDGNTVTIRIKRKKLFNVTASHVNGESIKINGLDSPQQIESGRTATFKATGSNGLLYWEINGEKFLNASSIINIVITEDTNAVAYFAGAGQTRLYCNDQFTTVSGVEKIGNFWLLNTGQSYTFNNSQTNFSGFLFSGDEEFSKKGAKTIKAEYDTLSVYYNKVLLNMTVKNLSPDYPFSGENIRIGSTALDFEILPSTTQKMTQSVDVDSIPDFDRLDYHYPTFTPSSFPTAGVVDLTINGNRVGWDGDVSISENQAGHAVISRVVYSPIAFTLTSDLTISPKSGSSNTNVSITLAGKGGKVIQKVGGFEYELAIEQRQTKPIGWNGVGTIIIDDEVLAGATSLTNDYFYHNNFPVVPSSGLTQGGNITEADGSVRSPMTAKFSANAGAERKLTFSAQCNGTAYMWNITQKGGASTAKATWWGQPADQNNVVKGDLQNADDITPSETATKNIGKSKFQYRTLYARRVDLGVDNYSEKNTGEAGISISGLNTAMYCFGSRYPSNTQNRGLLIQSSFDHYVGDGTPAMIRNIGKSHWDVLTHLYVGDWEPNLDSRVAFMDTNNYNLYSPYIGARNITATTVKATTVNATTVNADTVNTQTTIAKTITETSDINLKNIHGEVENVDLSSVGAYKFSYKDDDTNRVKVGVIAQEVEKICPEAIYGEEGNKAVNYNALVALLIRKVNQLENRINELENKK